MSHGLANPKYFRGWESCGVDRDKLTATIPQRHTQQASKLGVSKL